MGKTDAANPAKLNFRGNAVPEPVTAPARQWWIWGTLIAVWLVTLLPWRVWPSAPDILLVTLVFWTVHQPSRVGMGCAFIFGLSLDVHDAGLLGETALVYVLVTYGATVLGRRLQRFDMLGQAIHLAPVFFAAKFAVVVLHDWLAGNWPAWAWLLSVGLSIVCYPLWGWALQWSQRRGMDDESASG
jgi:rod shape-determining protein MreD